MKVDLWEVFVYLIIFGMFYSTPFLAAVLARKHKMRLAGEELALPLLAIIAGVGFYQGDWSTGIFGLTASAGYFLGLRHSHRRKAPSA